MPPSAPTATKWDPQQYAQFAAERTRPFHDLVSRVDVVAPREIADLGCGPGNLTAALADRWPTARVLGVDNSPEMLAEAEALSIAGRLAFTLEDLTAWQPDRLFDLIVSNATLQWVPGHVALLGHLASCLGPGGVLAFQVPGNFREPTHTLLAQLCSSEPWAGKLSSLSAPPSSHDPDVYLEALLGLGFTAIAWETTYLQVLEGENAVLNWMKGTALRPVLTVLSGEDRDGFLEDYGALLDKAYPAGAHGTVLPYRRVFAVGTRPGGDRPAAVSGLDHVQVAMPAGGEAAARSFYCGLLGFAEVAKPPVLARRGGCWFRAHKAEVHLGIEKGFRPAEKAHVALSVTDIDAVAARLASAGCRVAFDDELAPRRRFYTDDPFGNRVEIMAE